MKFKDNKISYEHIYWVQTSVFIQVGLLDSEKMPSTVKEIEQTKQLVELC